MFSRLKEMCVKYQYVSFDIFDTLIKRITEKPHDVFSIVQNMYLARYGGKKAIDDFPDLRITAERTARNRKHGEITLEEIYDVIGEYANKETADVYKKLETEVEKKVCVQFQPIKKIFDFCKSQGKQVYITSDMYLPREIIESILQNNGYYGYKRLFLSCESGNKKADGTLYEEIINCEGIKPKEILHIGDNIKSDVIMARKKGIHAFQIKSSKEKYPYMLDMAHSGNMLYRFIEYTNPYDSIFEDVGYGFFGPLLYGFITWIKEEAHTNKYDRVFFLSRDGFIMQKAYEKIREENDPRSQYFYASRRALQVAAIHLNPEYEYVMSHMFVPRTVNVKWLVKRWGLELENVKERIDDYSQNEEFQGAGILDNKRVKNLYDRLKEEIIINSKKEYKAFCDYIDQNKFNGNIAIVDIGWYGNMQNSLMEMLRHVERDIHLTGYYLGIVPESKYHEQYSMHGFIFEKNKNENLYVQLKYMASMLELFFMAPHGSAKRYVMKNDKATVELADFEFEGTDTYQKMAKLQDAALEFLNKYREREVEKYSETVYLSRLFKRFTKPDVKTAEEFGELQTWDDKWITLAEHYPAIKWIANPKKAVAKFLKASWKMGYLKRNVMLPLPYDKIVYRSRKLFKN